MSEKAVYFTVIELVQMCHTLRVVGQYIELWFPAIIDEAKNHCTGLWNLSCVFSVINDVCLFVMLFVDMVYHNWYRRISSSCSLSIWNLKFSIVSEVHHMGYFFGSKFFLFFFKNHISAKLSLKFFFFLYIFLGWV